MDTSPSLLERLRQPEPEAAWVRFVDLYTPLLYHWARRTGCRDDEAADLVQEVLTLLVRKLPEFTYEPGKSFRAWLRTVAANCWHNLRRRREPPRAANASVSEEIAAQQADPFWEAEYRRHLVGRALELMRTDFAETTWRACWACAVEGRPAADVARELGVRVGTVYAARSRVLSRLRQELADLWD